MSGLRASVRLGAILPVAATMLGVLIVIAVHLRDSRYGNETHATRFAVLGTATGFAVVIIAAVAFVVAHSASDRTITVRRAWQCRSCGNRWSD